MEQQRVALIGLAGVGGDYLAALRSEDGFDLVAVADTNREVLRQQVKPASGGSLGVYEDYRSLIVETAHAGLDLLFVALEPFQSIEFVELAASRGIGVFHKAPFARDVEEARRVIAQFEAHGCPLAVSRSWQHDCGLMESSAHPIRNPRKNLSELIGRVHAAAAIVRTADGADGWRGDRGRAGGGVLLNGAYEQVDMLISLLGVPESVYAQCSFQGAPGAVRKYDTEDAATLSLR
ncbi:MAG: Gfo/Idh/MocA family protein, partial [Planctomycetota bacterium]